jgi:4-amino-4-deoxy-L-arabinose transferase-like glycosyltransferase
MTKALKEELQMRLKDEFEIYILMAAFAVWYLINIGGAIKDDETIFALQGYYFFKGNLQAEQFRPLARYFFGLGQLMFGRTTFGAKFFVLIFSILSIYLTYKVARTLSSRENGFFAALIVGIIPLYGDLSVSGLMDIILTFFVLLLFFFTLRMLKTEDIVKKQRLIFFVGILCICTLATKLYGVFFSSVVFVLLIRMEWKTIRTVKIFKRKNIVTRFKKNLLLMPVFGVLGVGFGLLARAQLADFWNDAGEKGRTDILDVLPGFLDNIVLNMQSTSAYSFFIILGIVLFIILWVICALVGRESLRTLKCLAKKKPLDKKYHILILILGAIIGFVIIYSPYIWNPVVLFTQIMLNQTIHLTHTSPVEIDGVVYDKSPWWSYFYWTWIYLGLMFAVGLIISLCYFAYRFIKKEDRERETNFLLSYTFIPFILLSILSLKNKNYFVILFPLFTIFIIINITSIMRKLADLSNNKFLEKRTRIIQVAVIVILMLIPGPLWMSLDDPEMGWDSGYDTAGELVTEYREEHPNKDIRLVAFDKLSVEFYVSDEVLSEIEIIPLFGDNFSKDILGRPYLYYTDYELQEFVEEGEIDIFFDEPQRAKDRESVIRRHAENNSTSELWINDELVVYKFR